LEGGQWKEGGIPNPALEVTRAPRREMGLSELWGGGKNNLRTNLWVLKGKKEKKQGGKVKKRRIVGAISLFDWLLVWVIFR